MIKDLTAGFYVQNVEAVKKKLLRKRFSDRKLEVKVIEQGMVLPARIIDGVWKGGVCDKDFNFIAGNIRTEPPKKTTGGGQWCCVEYSYTVDRKEIVKLDEDVIFGGTLIGHFGHFMMECWSHLWYVIQNPELKLKVLFISAAHGGYKSWCDEFFKLMGIEKERIIYVKKATQCRSVIVPEQSQYISTHFTKEYLIPYQAIKSRVKPGKSKKLYLTRTQEEVLDKQKNWDSAYFNEKYFEDFFIRHGFESICMEKLTIEEQISLVMGADEIAAVMGTLTNWIMFCKPTVKFIMLNRTHKIPHFQYLACTAANTVNFYVVDVSKNFMNTVHAHGICLLGSTKYWKMFVADYFDESISRDDDKAYLENSLNAYIDFWCRNYFDTTSKNFDKLILTLKDMCNRIIKLERKVNKHK